MTTASCPPQGYVVDWAGLPIDLLACVSRLLCPVPGRVCFRAVCRSWRAADDLQHDGHPDPVASMPPPWLVIPLGLGCPDTFTLLSLLTMQAFRWTPPGGARIRCVGSSGGWIAGAYIDAAQKVRVSLLNPLTGARVDVPAPVRRVWFSPGDESGMRDKEEISLCSAVQKVAFSPSPTRRDFAVAVLTRTRGGGKAVAFTRAGCSGWCAVADVGPFEPGGDHVRAQLDVAYHGGKFYYMTMRAEVWAVDMAAPRPSPARVARFEPAVLGLVYRRHHLAFTGDCELHVVCSSIHHSESSGVDMVALRYDDPSRAGGSSSAAAAAWSEATCLRGQTFLIGDMNQTLCVRAGDGAWLRPDSVYFTNIPLCEVFAESRRGGSGGAWVLDLPTGDITRPSSKDAAGKYIRNEREQRAWGLNYSKCAWLMPSML